MTREEIIRMAREVGAGEPNDLYGRSDYVVMTRYELERFADLVAAAEREACASILDQNVAVCGTDSVMGDVLASNALAIRARGDA